MQFPDEVPCRGFEFDPSAAAPAPRRARFGLPVIIAALGGSLCPPAFLVAVRAFDVPLVPPAFCCGGGFAALEPSLAWTTVAGAAGLGAALMAAVVLAAANPRATRMGLSCIVVAAIALLVAASPRVLRPEPGRYLASLPEVGTLAAISGPPARVDAGAPWTWTPSDIHETWVGETLVTRVCQGQVCGLVVGRAPEGVGLWGEHAATVYAHAPVTLRHDARLDLWIAEQDGVRRAIRSGAAIPLDLATISPVTAPPRIWMVGGVAALLLAGLLVFGARRAERRAQTIQAGLRATLRDDGWLEMDDGLVPRRGPSVALPAGPVVVIPERGVLARGAGGVYRGDADGGEVIVAGERAALVAAAIARASSLRVLAASVIALGAAPLCAALRLGLLGLGS